MRDISLIPFTNNTVQPESTMELEESQISVWVCREEKLVLGLSKRTTCADVVQVLLEDQNSRHRLSAAQAYCIVEKWRGFERILPKRTKIFRLWVAWAEEQRNVKFVLLKSDASLAARRARSAEARVVPSRRSPRVSGSGTPRPPVGAIPPEKQRRIVRKAFRKLEKLNERRARVTHASCAERMETLVHRVLSQDHTLRQQVQRGAEVDAEIERCEAKVHLDRMRRHGVNYVQNTYLVDGAAASSLERNKLCSTAGRGGEHAQQREELVRIQEELCEQEALIDIITAQIQEELNTRWMQRRGEEPRQDPASLPASQDELQLEGERIKTQLDASLYIGLRLNTDLEAIRSDLELAQQMIGAREEKMRDLLEKVSTLDAEEGAGREKGCGQGADDEAGRMKGGWVEQARGLSTSLRVNDDDSDTGLSSLHSQDSDSLPVWESLV